MSRIQSLKCVDVSELAALIELDAESLRRIADRVDVNASQISGYLGGRAYLSTETRGRLFKGLGLTTAGRFSSRRAYSWFLGDSLDPLRRLLKFIFGDELAGNLTFEVKLIQGALDWIPGADSRGLGLSYAIRGMGFRAKVFRFKYSNGESLETFDPEALGGKWCPEESKKAVRLSEAEWDVWCQSTSVSDFDEVFFRGSNPDYCDFEQELQNRGHTWAYALALYRSVVAKNRIEEAEKKFPIPGKEGK